MTLINKQTNKQIYILSVIYKYAFSQAFFKFCELLSNLVRSDTNISSANFSVIVATIRRFTEIASSQGSLDHDNSPSLKSPKTGNKKEKNSQKQSKTAPKIEPSKQNSKLTYATASLRLLDLLDALYTRVPHVFDDQTVAKLHGQVFNGNGGVKSGQYLPESDIEGQRSCEGGVLWQVAWRPLLQGGFIINNTCTQLRQCKHNYHSII